MAKVIASLLGLHKDAKYDKLSIPKAMAALSPYILNHLLCFSCQQYGHHRDNCTNKAKCAIVDHSDCSKFQFNRDVQAFKCKQQVSFPEARKIVQETKVSTKNPMLKKLQIISPAPL